jgi:hypothetical protein
MRRFIQTKYIRKGKQEMYKSDQEDERRGLSTTQAAGDETMGWEQLPQTLSLRM